MFFDAADRRRQTRQSRPHSRHAEADRLDEPFARRGVARDRGWQRHALAHRLHWPLILLPADSGGLARTALTSRVSKLKIETEEQNEFNLK